MDKDGVLAERFEAHRARLRAVAYPVLGSASEADDAVQEAWLRLSRSDADNIENLGGWLITVVARVCPNIPLELGITRRLPGGGRALHAGKIAQRVRETGGVGARCQDLDRGQCA